MNLKQCTFIIPIRIESEDRMRNVITVLCYLLENFDTKVILKEVDTESVFEKEVLPQIKDYLGDAINNLTHVFEQSDDPVFYRMKIINEMLDISDTPVISNYDCDVLFTLFLSSHDCLYSNNASSISFNFLSMSDENVQFGPIWSQI